MKRLLVVAALSLAACSSSSTGGNPPAKDGGPVINDAGACVDPGRRVPDEGHTHILDGGHYSYVSQPPSSGPHWPRWGDWGEYSQPLARETYVHNEEHGGVILVYNCPSGCDDVVNAYRQLIAERPQDSFGEVKIVVTPDPFYDGGQIGAAAWDFVYTPASLNIDELRCFISHHIDQGPENAP